jgi:hypothetical protein
MKFDKRYLILFASLTILALVTFATKNVAATEGDKQFITASSLLNGLAPGAVFPFIDTTPHSIAQAHIAITDATTNCSPGAAPPSNVRVLVGTAGTVPPVLVSVMAASTNLGISTTPGQCVFHVTVTAGEGGVPVGATDIVVHNGGSSALTGVNTITASATVRVGDIDSSSHQHN